MFDLAPLCVSQSREAVTGVAAAYIRSSDFSFFILTSWRIGKSVNLYGPRTLEKSLHTGRSEPTFHSFSFYVFMCLLEDRVSLLPLAGPQCSVKQDWASFEG